MLKFHASTTLFIFFYIIFHFGGCTSPIEKVDDRLWYSNEKLVQYEIDSLNPQIMHKYIKFPSKEEYTFIQDLEIFGDQYLDLSFDDFSNNAVYFKVLNDSSAIIIDRKSNEGFRNLIDYSMPLVKMGTTFIGDSGMFKSDTLVFINPGNKNYYLEYTPEKIDLECNNPVKAVFENNRITKTNSCYNVLKNHHVKPVAYVIENGEKVRTKTVTPELFEEDSSLDMETKYVFLLTFNDISRKLLKEGTGQYLYGNVRIFRYCTYREIMKYRYIKEYY